MCIAVAAVVVAILARLGVRRISMDSLGPKPITLWRRQKTVRTTSRFQSFVGCSASLQRFALALLLWIGGAPGVSLAADTPPVATSAQTAQAASAAEFAASSAANAATAATAAAAAAKSIADALAPAKAQYGIDCVYVIQTGLIQVFKETVRHFSEAASEVKYSGDAICRQDKTIPIPDRTLVGGGDLVVVVSAANYLTASGGKTDLPLLYLNGFDLGEDAVLVSADRSGASLGLHFRVKPGTQSQILWTTLYNEHGMVVRTPLQAEVGWKGRGVVFTRDKVPDSEPRSYISVSNWLAVGLAFALGAFLLGFFIWSMWWTDTFRSAPTFPWWNDARALRLKVYEALNPGTSAAKLKKIEVGAIDSKNVAAVAAAIKALYKELEYALPDTTYTPAAKALLAGKMPATTADTTTLIVGLAVYPDHWYPRRLSFSLARVQWGLWMMFATATAVFLWVVYGLFPVLQGSVLALVTVSTVTVGASIIVDNNSTGPTTSLTRGFVRDLMTSPDNVQQAHRYQAIVVNLLLLAVGVVFVVQHLAYPTFDSSWLGLLTLSGVAQTAGKQLLETPPTKASGAPVGSTAPAGGGGAPVAQAVPANQAAEVAPVV